MGRTWMNARLFSREHREGVNEFMNFVSENLSGSQEILCPCRKCLNRLKKYKGEVEDHILMLEAQVDSMGFAILVYFEATS